MTQFDTLNHTWTNSRSSELQSLRDMGGDLIRKTLSSKYESVQRLQAGKSTLKLVRIKLDPKSLFRP